MLLWQRHWNYCSLPPSLSIFYQMKYWFFATTVKASTKMFYVEVILEPLRHSFLVFLFFIDEKNTSILNTTIDYIHSTKRVDVPLTNFWFILKHLVQWKHIFQILLFKCQIKCLLSFYYIILLV